MSVDGRAVANFILDYCAEKDRTVTNLSLQKILYFCHVWSLIRLGKPLIKHNFEAWEYGPVLQYVYREFKNFGRDPILERAKKIDVDTGGFSVVEHQFDGETTFLLAQVVDFYSQLSASDLVSMSHIEGGPWADVWNHDGKINPGMKIENDAIVDFYMNMSAPFSIQ